jgi:hypothetical protein
MKITSMKTIYLSEAELKNILADYIGKYNSTLAHHMAKNHCTMEWINNKFTISMDGEVIEERIVLPHMAESKPSQLSGWAITPKSRTDDDDIPF